MREPGLVLVPGPAIGRILERSPEQCVEIVETAYRLWGSGRALAPPSSFLTFPSAPENRIIALSAQLCDERPVSGLKWIASYPNNVARGLPRASAVIILNDAATGRPFALMDGALISALRTAASALTALRILTRDRRRIERFGVIGAGAIARTTYRLLLRIGWEIRECIVYDLKREAIAAFERSVADLPGPPILAAETFAEALATSDVVLFATLAREPYVTDASLFAHKPVVAHLSLRDLDPTLLRRCYNVVDDVEHVLSARTSLHLAELAVGTRDFITCTLPELLTTAAPPKRDRPIVFSPFGLGVLDVALARWVHGESAREGTLLALPDFFAEPSS